MQGRVLMQDKAGGKILGAANRTQIHLKTDLLIKRFLVFGEVSPDVRHDTHPLLQPGQRVQDSCLQGRVELVRAGPVKGFQLCSMEIEPAPTPNKNVGQFVL